MFEPTGLCGCKDYGVPAGVLHSFQFWSCGCQSCCEAWCGDLRRGDLIRARSACGRHFSNLSHFESLILYFQLLPGPQSTGLPFSGWTIDCSVLIGELMGLVDSFWSAACFKLSAHARLFSSSNLGSIITKAVYSLS